MQNLGMKTRVRGIIVALLSLIMAACDAGPSAVITNEGGKAQAPKHERAPFWADKSTKETATQVPAQDEDQVRPQDTRSANASATVDRFGKWPLWSSNRQYSADENAHYHFEKHGSEFGAANFEQYMATVHGFIHHPPPGSERIARNNGDTLIYDAKSNTFAVMTKKGAPRTMFHPDNGIAYWQKQKQIESTRRTWRRYGSGGSDDEGG